MTPPQAHRQLLAGDASARRYLRCDSGGGSTVVECHYPRGEHDTLARDVAVRRWLAARGLAVPAILNVDHDRRVVTLEDLGDVDAAASLAAAPSAAQSEILARLVEPICTLARIATADLPLWNPPLDQRLLRFELTGFELWYLRIHRAAAPPAPLGSWLDALAATVGGHPKRVCHRDYHLNNLFLDRQRMVRMIDEQDLRLGPDTYDIASLLWDRSAGELLSEEQRAATLATWATRSGASAGWEARAVAVRVQRSLKVLGTFARLAAAGRHQYRRWLPTVEASLAAPLAALAAPTWLRELLLD